MTQHSGDISLPEARALIARGIDKAAQLNLAGAIAVCGASGVLVSASRMDHGGAGGMARARSKAWISATQKIPSAEHLKRMNFVAPPVERGFANCSPEARFPGAGGMPIRDDGIVIGGIAASGATVSPFFGAGTEPEQMISDGQPANPEDLLVHYALGIPYVGQHGDDYARWTQSFGRWPANPAGGIGMSEAPAATGLDEHRWALSLSDAVLEQAAQRGVRVAVAVTDHYGEPIQQDWMAGAPTAAVYVALATAATAASFGLPSAEVGATYGVAALSLFTPSLPFAVLPSAGGLPIEADRTIVGGLGIAGTDPAAAADLAASVLARWQRP
jgi:uncharacterized protein GlcG (DUF336 family)